MFFEPLLPLIDRSLPNSKLFLLVLFAIPVLAQPSLVLSGRVLDPSGAPVASLPITVQSRGTITNDAGEFRFDALLPGIYELRTAAPGFNPLVQKLKLGSRNPAPIEIRLVIRSVKETLAVAESERSVTAQASSNADTISVERTMLDNLPVLDNNYIAALSRFLDPSGSGTTLIVDGMEMRNVGMTASAIQEIRINNNPYTAEYPRWSRRRIEVITKTSADAFHGTLNFLYRDYHLNARDAFATQRTHEQRRIFEGSLFGPVGRAKRTSFLLSAAREAEDLVAVVFAQGVEGPIRENVPTPKINTVASLRLSHQFNEKHAIFLQQNFQDSWQNNRGVGGTTLASAGEQLRFREDESILNHRAVLSPKLLSQFRFLIARYWAPLKANLVAPRLVVSDAFTGGGAQSDRLATEFHTAITWLITQTVGKHTLKYGINIPDWSRRGLSDRSNQLGTLSYASLADFAANRPFSILLQRGDPRVVFIEKTIGGFFQDEWQLRPNLSVSAGVRYDWQNVFGDANNFAPRLSLAYAPGKSRKTVLRSGAGFFFDRSGPAPILDILRFNGTKLRRSLFTGADLLGGTGFGAPTSIHQLDPAVQLPNTMQFSVAVERQLAKKTTLAVSYIGTRGVQQFRSRDANAPLPSNFSVRPNPALNVLRQIESAGRVVGDNLEVTLRGDLGPKLNGMVRYVLSRTLSDTGGLNWFPANSYAPSGEWGRADTDRRHQFNFLGTASLHRWANFGLAVSVLSGVPFNITTGRDNNGDGLALDRPDGVSRNTGLGPGQALVDLRWFRDFRFQPARKDKSPSLTVGLDAFNLFNRVNYQGFAGALTSPFYGRAFASQPARRIQLGLRLQF